jgi:hypothetical protein
MDFMGLSWRPHYILSAHDEIQCVVLVSMFTLQWEKSSTIEKKVTVRPSGHRQLDCFLVRREIRVFGLIRVV